MLRIFIFGFVTGIIVSAIGFSGVIRMLDRGVEQIKVQSVQALN